MFSLRHVSTDIEAGHNVCSLQNREAYDALLITLEPFEELRFPLHVAVLTISPDIYIGRAIHDGLVRTPRQWVG